MATTFIAFFEGKSFTRSSKTRVYTHVVIVHGDISFDRKLAYSIEPTSAERGNYDWYKKVSKMTPGKLYFPWVNGSTVSFRPTHKEVEGAKSAIDGGFDEYVNRCRQKRIEDFEKRAADGYYDHRAYRWSINRINAERGVAEASRLSWIVVDGIVECHPLVR